MSTLDWLRLKQENPPPDALRPQSLRRPQPRDVDLLLMHNKTFAAEFVYTFSLA